MKLKENFILRSVADTWVVMPIDAATLDFNGMITLNESGALLWQTLEQGGDADAMAEALCSRYEVNREEALADAREFIQKLLDAGCAEE